MDIIEQLQLFAAPEIFTPRVVYDGRKNIFAIRQLPFGPSDSQEVSRSSLRGFIFDLIFFASSILP
jgi:hypothetical protein